jgi:serine/threonine protein kinase
MVGTTLGQYKILEKIGAGGMDEVYRAEDPKLGREVAIKVLPEGFTNDAERLARFEREAQAVAALSHPNILSIFDFGTQDGITYAVMELLEGETLRQLVAAGPIPNRKALDYARQLADGLAAAHHKGIIHRDLKPENVFVSRDGRVKILDFGLARQTALTGTGTDTHSPTLADATEAGAVLGTVGYMSPEQVKGDPADARSDIFSLGLVLYEMLGGERAFERETGAEIMTAILREDPPELSTKFSNLSPSVDRLVRHCLEKRPEERFQSARDLAFDLESMTGFSTTGVVPTIEVEGLR